MGVNKKLKQFIPYEQEIIAYCKSRGIEKPYIEITDTDVLLWGNATDASLIDVVKEMGIARRGYGLYIEYDPPIRINPRRFRLLEPDSRLARLIKIQKWGHGN